MPKNIKREVWKEGYSNLRKLLSDETLTHSGQFVRVWKSKQNGFVFQIYNAKSNRVIATYGHRWLRVQKNSVYVHTLVDRLMPDRDELRQEVYQSNTDLKLGEKLYQKLTKGNDEKQTTKHA